MNPRVRILSLIAAVLPSCAVSPSSSKHGPQVTLASYPYQGSVSAIHREFARELHSAMEARGISISANGYGHMFVSVERARASEARRAARIIKKRCAERHPNHEQEIDAIRVDRWIGEAS